MLVSHKLKLIFIHIPKNAGTFMWNLLKRLDNDLVVYFNTKDSNRNTLHNKGKDIKDLCNFDYSEYIIFCVIRDPIERVLSLYNYISGNEYYPTYNIVKCQSFREFIEYSFSKTDFLETNYISQYDFMYDETNKLLINKIIRYERLHKELKDMLMGIKGINMSENELEEILTVRINESKKLINNVDKETEELILKKIPEVEKEMDIFNYKIDKLVIVQAAD
jgi:hypothetical protein